MYSSRVIKFGHLIRCRQIQLLIDQTQTLLRKKLGREFVCPFAPITFFSTLVDKGKLPFTISVNVVTLSTGFDKRAKWIVRVILNLLQNIRCRSALFLISIEHYIHTIGKIIRIDSHSFQISIAVHQDTNLSIMGITERQVIYTTTNFDNTVFLDAAIFRITNFQATRIHTFGIDELVKCFTFIVRYIVSDRMNILEIINFFMLCSWRAENLDVCLLTRVCYLGNTAAIDRITFHFQNIKSLVHLLF